MIVLLNCFLMIKIKNKKQEFYTIQKLHNGNNLLFCKIFFVFFFGFLFEFFFRNHLQGQDTLHIDVFDEDKLKDDRIGSAKIDLKNLYEKSFFE